MGSGTITAGSDPVVVAMGSDPGSKPQWHHRSGKRKKRTILCCIVRIIFVMGSDPLVVATGSDPITVLQALEHIGGCICKCGCSIFDEKVFISEAPQD